MPIQRHGPSRSGRRTENGTELTQHQRRLDNEGALASDPPAPLPVMWSPVALSARLEAERALQSLGHRSWAVCARARSEMSRVVAAVERRQLSLSAATAQLRELSERLRLHRLAEESRRGPREWQPLRPRAQSTTNAPASRRNAIPPTAVGGSTNEEE